MGYKNQLYKLDSICKPWVGVQRKDILESKRLSYCSFEDVKLQQGDAADYYTFDTIKQQMSNFFKDPDVQQLLKSEQQDGTVFFTFITLPNRDGKHYKITFSHHNIYQKEGDLPEGKATFPNGEAKMCIKIKTENQFLQRI